MRSQTFCVLALAALFLAGSACLGKPMVIYGGQPLSSAGMSLDGWGSGSARESNDKTYAGAASIRMTTQGLFKGGRIDFATPVQFVVGAVDKSEYLQFALNFTTASVVSGGLDTGLPFAAGQTPPAGGFDEYQTVVRPKVNRIRLLLEDESGEIIEVQQPVSVSRIDEAGWAKVAVPLAAIKWPAAAEQFRLKRLIFSTDVPDTIYIGEIRVIVDNTPITADAGEEKVVAARDVIVFNATAEGGASTLVYSWDFDKSDGIQEDATGQVTSMMYTKRGEYDVTLTVKDYYGLKTPGTAVVRVSVGD